MWNQTEKPGHEKQTESYLFNYQLFLLWAFVMLGLIFNVLYLKCSDEKPQN
jgi:hypothetical protein